MSTAACELVLFNTSLSTKMKSSDEMNNLTTVILNCFPSTRDAMTSGFRTQHYKHYNGNPMYNLVSRFITIQALIFFMRQLIGFASQR